MKYFLIAVVFVFTSCQSLRLSVADRHYRNGFYFHLSTVHKTITRDSVACVNKEVSVVPNDVHIVQDTLTAASAMTLQAENQTPGNTPVPVSSGDTIAPHQAIKRVSFAATDPPVFPAAPAMDVDWNLMGIGFVLSLLVPFLFPFFLWLTARTVEDDRQWWAFLVFMLALAASAIAVVLVVQANPMWWMFYVLAFAISLATTIYISTYPSK